MIKQYVKRVNKEIYDINNEPFTLQGVGIGGWLLIEGYMIKSFDKIDRPRTIDSFIISKTSTEYLRKFKQKWIQSFFGKKDLYLIKEQGFNSIRIPIDYQFLFLHSNENVELSMIEHNFIILDGIIELCENIGLYVILDMHAAPGGQTGTNIDNSENNKPELFINEIFQSQLCYIWKQIADRYQDNQFIAAYDILNEPLPNWFSQYNDLLMPLYKRVIESIREVDSNHIITLEGLHWATDWDCFNNLKDGLIDENLLLQFHKYWSNPDVQSIQTYLDIRETLNLPIFMGEGGENNHLWYSSVFKMYDQLNISYNFWTYKKMENHNSIISFQTPPEWENFLLDKLTDNEAEFVLDTLLKNIEFDNCTINQATINHIQQKNTFSSAAYGFDYDKNKLAYYGKRHLESSCRNDTNIEILNHENKIIVPNFKQYSGEEYDENEKLQVILQKNEWINYSFHSEELFGEYEIFIDTPTQDRIAVYINQERFVMSNNILKFRVSSHKNRLMIRALDSVIIRGVSFHSKKLKN